MIFSSGNLPPANVPPKEMSRAQCFEDIFRRLGGPDRGASLMNEPHEYHEVSGRLRHLNCEGYVA